MYVVGRRKDAITLYCELVPVERVKSHCEEYPEAVTDTTALVLKNHRLFLVEHIIYDGAAAAGGGHAVLASPRHRHTKT